LCTQRHEAYDSILKKYAITQETHLHIDINDIHSLLQPAKGKFGLIDYEKVFSAERTNGILLGQIPGIEANQDIYQLRGVNRKHGAVVIVRPDQYIGHVLSLAQFQAFDQYFDGFLLDISQKALVQYQ